MSFTVVFNSDLQIRAFSYIKTANMQEKAEKDQVNRRERQEMRIF